MAQPAQRGGAAQPAGSSSSAARSSQVEADTVPASPSWDIIAPLDQLSCGDSFSSIHGDDELHPLHSHSH